MQNNELQLTRESSLKLKEEILRNATDKSGKKMMNPLKLPEIFTYFDTPGKEKKWTAPNADLTDYFNYGFTEDTFKAFSHKVKTLFSKLQKTGGAHFKQSGESDKFYEDRVPISHGGLEIIDDKALKEIVIMSFLSYFSHKFFLFLFISFEYYCNIYSLFFYFPFFFKFLSLGNFSSSKIKIRLKTHLTS